MRVLLIDDHPLILAALQTVIQGLGEDVQVLGADSAAQARDTLKSRQDFDLVLLDLNLGDASGFDVLEEFRAQYPSLPVVVISASDRASDVIRAIDQGAMGFIPKRTGNDVLALLLQGKPNKIIARELGVSVETIKDHVAAVLKALGVSSRTQAVLAVGQMVQRQPNAAFTTFR